MNGIDQDVSRINPCASLAVLIRRNFKLIIILQMLSFLIMIGASTVVSAENNSYDPDCPREYKLQGNACVAERTSYIPKEYSFCGLGGTYIGAGQCAVTKANAEDIYSGRCIKGMTKDGGSCIEGCYRTHTKKDGKCHIKSYRLGSKYMTCITKDTYRKGARCIRGHGNENKGKLVNHSLYIDCDHPSISNEWTKSVVVASLLDAKRKVLISTRLDKVALSKKLCTRKFTQNFLPVWSTKTFGQAGFVELTIQGGDGLYIDALRLQSGDKSKQWGKSGGKGWCMSTQPKDGGGSWKNFTGNNCYSRLSFNIKTGKVIKLR